MKKDNPFTLTFGKKPPEYITRYDNMNTIISTFTSDNPVSQSYLIEGIRGSGKTVLMTSVANELRDDDWVVLDLNSTQDLLNDMALRIEQEYKRLPDLFKTGFNISVAGFGVGVSGNPDINNPISVIDGYLSFFKKKKKNVLITIDEAMPNENMRHFASEFQLYIRKDYPVYLLMTGLYENIDAIQNDPALTFLLRSPKINLEPLSIHQIIKQYKNVFDITEEMAVILAETTKGYAFAFQALGMLYYEYRDELSFDDILLKLDDLLDDFVYKKIWSSLSEVDRNVVRALSDDKVKVAEICSRLNMQSSSFSRYRERLVKKGVLDASQHGYVSLLLPRFSYVCRSYS